MVFSSDSDVVIQNNSVSDGFAYAVYFKEQQGIMGLVIALFCHYTPIVVSQQLRTLLLVLQTITVTLHNQVYMKSLKIFVQYMYRFVPMR